MGLFDKIKEPVFFKDDSRAEVQLVALQELKKTATGEVAEEIEQEIRRMEAGIYGEKAVRYELENSYIHMFVLHDLYLEHEGLTAQIDYMIITRKHVFILECKNLYGNIEINSAGDFVRTVAFGRHIKKEGIYSPVTLNSKLILIYPFQNFYMLIAITESRPYHLLFLGYHFFRSRSYMDIRYRFLSFAAVLKFSHIVWGLLLMRIQKELR